MVLNRRFNQPPASMRPKRRQDITQNNVYTLFQSPDFQDTIARRLAGAVQIPTCTYDNMGSVGEDPRWEIFYEFSDYIKKTFPRVWASDLPITIKQVANILLLDIKHLQWRLLMSMACYIRGLGHRKT